MCFIDVLVNGNNIRCCEIKNLEICRWGFSFIEED